MGLLPDESDRQPRETIFWVSRRGGGISSLNVGETDDDVEKRLGNEFPIYRLKRAGANVLKKVVRLKNDEI